MSEEYLYCKRCNGHMSHVTELGLTRIICRGCRLNDAVETQRMDRERREQIFTIKDNQL